MNKHIHEGTPNSIPKSVICSPIGDPPPLPSTYVYNIIRQLANFNSLILNPFKFMIVYQVFLYCCIYCNYFFAWKCGQIVASTKCRYCYQQPFPIHHSSLCNESDFYMPALYYFLVVVTTCRNTLAPLN